MFDSIRPNTFFINLIICILNAEKIFYTSQNQNTMYKKFIGPYAIKHYLNIILSIQNMFSYINEHYVHVDIVT